MILGITVTPILMLIGGIALLTLIGFEMLVGLRKIKFGRRTNLYHKYIAYTILGLGAVHGLLSVLFVTGWTLL